MRPTADRLRHLFNYDPATGVLTRRVRTSNRVKVGEVPGTLKDGYRSITVDGCRCRSNRMAVAIVTGVWPDDGLVVDHIDGNRSNDAWANLRVVSRQINQWNTVDHHSNNTSGTRGVFWDKSRNQWMSSIRVKGRQIHLGRFDDIADAATAYEAARVKYHGGSQVYGGRLAS